MKPFLKLLMMFVLLLSRCGQNDNSSSIMPDITEIDRERILTQADQYLDQEPRTVTASVCERSQGGVHDFYSEGDYWWPDPDNPNGPYIRRDGMTNPDNFTDHRQAMRRMSIHVAALTAAFKITGEARYADHAIEHIRAWFIDDSTRMNPNMKYAQAIKGRVPGRGVGLIDGIHLVEPARAISYLAKSEQLSPAEFDAVKAWFSDFITFMTDHEYGIDERKRENNHGTCWVMQAAEFACLTGNLELQNYCRKRYNNVLLPNQMSKDGSFHMELSRTKPYGYSLFNLDAMTMVCHILSTPDHNLWTYETPDGCGIQKAMEFMVPYIANKSSWPYKPDVMYWDEWPVRHPSLLFAGSALNRPDYIELWKTLPPEPKTEEGLRNFPIRQPVLWLE